MRHVLPAYILVALSFSVHAGEWHSTGGEFTFDATIEGVAAPGQFRKFAVTFGFDPASPENGDLRVTVDLRAADMGDPDMNEVLFDPAWFDIGQFTEAVYESESLRETSPGEFVATGTLSLKGADKPVEVPFAWANMGDKASMRGQLVLQRTDFDVGSGEWATDDSIGVDVTLRFLVELERCE